jgi:biopolymer transport protein ExbD
MSEINITSLADVMLVLLIIFMVTTPLIMIESFKIKLPSAVSTTPEPGGAITIEVSETGAIELNGVPVTIDRLQEGLLGELAAAGANRHVLLMADGETRHNIVVRVLDIARLAGAGRLSIATRPPALE